MKPTTTATATTTTTTKHVFCFGDSLTHGTSPPQLEEYPYGKHLRDALLSYGPDASEGVSAPLPATVEWLGLPGWTSRSLLREVDLKGCLVQMAAARRRDPQATAAAAAGETTATTNLPPFDLVIILAGTNDLGYETEPRPIVESIRGIHAIAHGLGCPTIALGIPPSGYQSVSTPARNLAGAVNRELEAWAAETAGAAAADSPTARYVPHPIRDFDPSGGLWAPDGLHLSPEGYRFVAEELAPIVAEILWDDPRPARPPGSSR